MYNGGDSGRGRALKGRDGALNGCDGAEKKTRAGQQCHVIDIFNKCQETDVDKNRGSVLENHGVGRVLLENPHYMGISLLPRRLKICI